MLRPSQVSSDIEPFVKKCLTADQPMVPNTIVVLVTAPTEVTKKTSIVECAIRPDLRQ